MSGQERNELEARMVDRGGACLGSVACQHLLGPAAVWADWSGKSGRDQLGCKLELSTHLAHPLPHQGKAHIGRGWQEEEQQLRPLK